MVLVALEVELAGTARRPLRLHLSRDVGLAWLAGYSPPLPETSCSQPRVRLRDLIGIDPRHEHSAVVHSSRSSAPVLFFFDMCGIQINDARKSALMSRLGSLQSEVVARGLPDSENPQRDGCWTGLASSGEREKGPPQPASSCRPPTSMKPMRRSPSHGRTEILFLSERFHCIAFWLSSK
jgi:hypothetical protein